MDTHYKHMFMYEFGPEKDREHHLKQAIERGSQAQLQELCAHKDAHVIKAAHEKWKSNRAKALADTFNYLRGG